MNETTRRKLFAGIPLITLGFITTSCANMQNTNPPTNNTISQIEQAINAILNGLTVLVGQLIILNIPNTTVANIQNDIKKIQDILLQIQTTLSSPTVQTIVTTLVMTLKEVLTLTTGLSLPAPLKIILQAIAVLMPWLESLVGLPATSSYKSVSPMTVEQALSILQSAH
jgi:hypothetical protein